MKYYIIAGEASGDLHGSNLMKAIQQKDPEANFRVWGGDLMQNNGGILVKHYKDLAFMGFLEVLTNIKTILKNITLCKKDIQEFQPDKIIFIDYPGFNLRIAPFAKKLGIETIYYISPQLWAWKENRVRILQQFIDKTLVILPFEKAFYEEKHNHSVSFVGHPLLDAIQDLPIGSTIATGKPIIALLPGSRKQEITKMLPLFLQLITDYKDYEFVIAKAPSISIDFYQNIIKNNTTQTPIIYTDGTYPLLKQAHVALVTSGTATLETALFNIPQVVCYKGSNISYQIAKRLIKNIKYISLVNLIMDKMVVKELIQNDFTLPNLQLELNTILQQNNFLKIKEEYTLLREKLGEVGASERAATIIVEK